MCAAALARGAVVWHLPVALAGVHADAPGPRRAARRLASVYPATHPGLAAGRLLVPVRREAVALWDAAATLGPRRGWRAVRADRAWWVCRHGEATTAPACIPPGRLDGHLASADVVRGAGRQYCRRAESGFQLRRRAESGFRLGRRAESGLQLG